MRLIHLVAEAMAEKTRKMKERTFVQRINEVFAGLEIAKEQTLMAQTIAYSTDVEELP